MNEPATKQDLIESMGELRGEMRDMEGRLRSEMTDMEGRLLGTIAAQGTELRGEMRDMEGRLRTEIVGEIRGAVVALSEDFRRQVSAFDDKYRDVPGQIVELRGRHDAHVADTAIHLPPPNAPKRSRSH